ncbi:POK18 protein, partial [Certhia familiaris]|nr:POK18 protein [Certhia familiaris]
FAFSVPSINREAPMKRYHWRVLPQGLKCSPSICQYFVASLLSPVHVQCKDAIIHHYMDDILVCGPSNTVLESTLDLVQQLQEAGLPIAPEEVQQQAPWKYLGMLISEAQIWPQKLTICTEIQTLTDAQKLIGDIQWIPNTCGITNDDLEPLMPLLKGDNQANLLRELTEKQQKALTQIATKLG